MGIRKLKHQRVVHVEPYNNFFISLLTSRSRKKVNRVKLSQLLRAFSIINFFSPEVHFSAWRKLWIETIYVQTILFAHLGHLEPLLLWEQFGTIKTNVRRTSRCPKLQTLLQQPAEMPKSNPKGCPSSDGALGICHASVIYPQAGPASWGMANPWGQWTRGEMSYFFQPQSNSGRCFMVWMTVPSWTGFILTPVTGLWCHWWRDLLLLVSCPV